jgi:hypothetical protein
MRDATATRYQAGYRLPRHDWFPVVALRHLLSHLQSAPGTHLLRTSSRLAYLSVQDYIQPGAPRL